MEEEKDKEETPKQSNKRPFDETVLLNTDNDDVLMLDNITKISQFVKKRKTGQRPKQAKIKPDLPQTLCNEPPRFIRMDGSKPQYCMAGLKYQRKRFYCMSLIHQFIDAYIQH